MSNTKIFSMLVALMLSSCVLQDNQLQPKNYSPIVNTTVVPPPVVNETNVTNSTPVTPPKLVLLPVQTGLGVYILDNEKKGSYVIELNNKSMLINAVGGSDTLRNLKIMRNLGIQRLDYLLLTNEMDDNIAGASSFILKMKPVELIHSGIASRSGYYKQYNLLYPNSTIIPFDTTINIDDVLINIIVPYDDGNAITGDNTMLVKLTYGSMSILFATDCGIDCESRVSDVQANILVSNGGCDSVSFAFLKDVAPEFVVFSSVPCKETLDRVVNLNIPVLKTSSDGDVLIASNGVKYEYRSLKNNVT